MLTFQAVTLSEPVTSTQETGQMLQTVFLFNIECALIVTLFNYFV